MVLVETVRAYLEAILAGIGIMAATAKSAYNGILNRRVFRRLRRAEEAHKRTVNMSESMARMEQKLDRIDDRSERQVDYLIALGKAANEDDVEFDVDQLREEHDRGGADDFVRR